MTRNSQSGRPGARASSLPAALRFVIAFFLPLAAGLLVILFVGGLSPDDARGNESVVVLLLGPLGITSWLLGLRWYGLPGLGLRVRRPLFAGIGFASLGWVAFLLFRFFLVYVDVDKFGQGNSGRTYVFLLLFEAFAVQLWTYGLLFRTLSDWRGPLTAAIGSGVIFGTLGNLLFQEAFVSSISGYLYFLIWGVLYGVIRLRTGSLLGTMLVQSVQSFTAWIVLAPPSPPDANQLQYLYIASGLAYLLFVWRLWPKQQDDYRV